MSIGLLEHLLAPLLSSFPLPNKISSVVAVEYSSRESPLSLCLVVYEYLVNAIAPWLSPASSREPERSVTEPVMSSLSTWTE